MQLLNRLKTSRTQPGPRYGRLFQLVAGSVLCSLAAGCGAAAGTASDTLKLGAYSVVREVFHEGLIPAFAARWKSKTGRDVQFEESYSGSGRRPGRSPRASMPTWRSCRTKATWSSLVKEGKVKADWNAGPHHGILTHSLVVIGHRPGNPKGIRGWTDLARDGVGVLYPDPKTSGGARWNINAIYGAGLLAAREANPRAPDLAPVRELLGASRPT